MAEPFGFDPFGFDDFGFNFGSRPLPRFPTLPPRERDTLFNQIGGAAFGGLQLIGNILDTPGSVARGLLAGEPSRAFGGVFDPEQRVSGRELLSTYGLTTPNDPNAWEAADVYGFLADVFTDPLAWLAPLPLTTKGLAQSKAGSLTKGLGPSMEAGERALVGFGPQFLPFAPQAATFGSGPGSVAFGYLADDLVKSVGDLPGINYLRAAFNPAGRQALTPVGWEVGTQVTERADDLSRAARETGFDLRELALRSGASNDELRGILEGTVSPITPELRAFEQAWREIAPQTLEDLQAEGARIAGLTDQYAQFAPRHKVFLDPKKRTPYDVQALPSVFGDMIAREEALRDIPGGTLTLNRLSLDPTLSSMPLRNLRETIRQRVFNFGPGERDKLKLLRQAARAGRMTPKGEARLKELMDRFVKGGQLAKTRASWGNQYVEAGVPIFGNPVTEDIQNYLLGAANVRAGLEGQNELINRFATDVPGPDTVLVKDVLRSHGTRMNPQIAGAGKYLPKQIADEIMRINRSFRGPEEATGILAGFDSLTNLFRPWVTAFWPANKVRDFTTGTWINLAEGFNTPAMLPRNLAIANRLMRGDRVIEGLERFYPGLTPAQATRQFKKDLYATNAIGMGNYPIADVVGATQIPTGKMAHQIPGEIGVLPGSDPLQQAANLLRSIKPEKGKLREGLNPLGVRGVGGRTDDTFTLIKAGRKLDEWQSGVNRTAGVLGLMEQGFSPQAAAARMMEGFGDFTKFTPFERAWMKRLFPFYSFSRQVLPGSTRRILQRPGGVESQTIQAANEARANEEYVPEWLGHGLAIPVGGEPGGQRRFLTQFDLPFEPLGNFMRFGHTPAATMQETLSGIAGSLNPLIKAPLELAAGRQFFSGRDLSELDSRLGRIAQAVAGLEQPPNSAGLNMFEHLLMNSPLSRVVTSTGTLLDPRKDALAKATNLLTGARVTDVDVEKAANLAIRRAIEELLRQNPSVKPYTKLSVPRGLEKNLSPEEINLMRLYQTLGMEAAEAARRRRATAFPVF